jgi:hypothetical protein
MAFISIVFVVPIFNVREKEPQRHGGRRVGEEAGGDGGDEGLLKIRLWWC